MIDRGSKLPVTRQAELLDLSRSSVYYTPRPLSDRDLGLMRRLDELHLLFCRSATWLAFFSRKDKRVRIVVNFGNKDRYLDVIKSKFWQFVVEKIDFIWCFFHDRADHS